MSAAESSSCNASSVSSAAEASVSVSSVMSPDPTEASGRTRREELVEERLRTGCDRAPAIGVFCGQKVESVRFGRVRPSLSANEHTAQVVPDAERAAAPLDEAVESSIGDRTQIERGGAERSELAPGDPLMRHPRYAHHSVRERRGLGGFDHATVSRRSLAASRLVT